MTKNEQVKLYTKNRVYMYRAIRLVYKKNVKIILTLASKEIKMKIKL